MLTICVLLLLGLLARDAASMSAQSSGAVVTFYGQVRLGGPFAPAGTVVQVVTAQTADDVTECGRATVGANGDYTLDIQPSPVRCVNRTTDERRPPNYLFLIHGTQVEAHGRIIVNPVLSLPQSLGARYQRDLDGPLIPGLPPNAPQTVSTLIRVRYWGQVTLGGRFARNGTVVEVVNARTGAACGTGQVRGDLGDYVVDVPATPGVCVDRSNDDTPINLAFRVDGQEVAAHGRDIVHAVYSIPESLAHDYRRDLEGNRPQTELSPPAESPPQSAEVAPPPMRPLQGTCVVEVPVEPLPPSTPLTSPPVTIPDPVAPLELPPPPPVGEPAPIGPPGCPAPTRPPSLVGEVAGVGLRCLWALYVFCLTTQPTANDELHDDPRVHIDEDEEPCWEQPPLPPAVMKVYLPMHRYPESAAHIVDAQRAHYPRVVTLDRNNAAAVDRRRTEATDQLQPRADLDRDEYPLAAFLEGGYYQGRLADVRYVSIPDNRGAGKYMGAQWAMVPDTTKMEICVMP